MNKQAGQSSSTAPIFRVGKRWVFQPFSTVTDSGGFVWKEGKKRRHEAHCLGGTVICRAWKKSKPLGKPIA